MICEILQDYDGFGNFLGVWLTLSALGFVLIMGMSGTFFYLYYAAPTFEQWQRKSNPAYPKAEMVRDEIIQMIKGMLSATLCPAASIWLAKRGLSKSYCGGGVTWAQTGQFFALWLLSDFFEWGYHRLGHVYPWFWRHHKSHHRFYNPTPFAVIADEYLDQFIRSSLLLVLPVFFPINMDIIFFQYAAFFYAYGVYLHLGYESETISAHHPIINSSFQHYCHHARSVLGKPYHTGFMIKLWDQMAGSVWPEGACFCAECDAKKGNRTRKAYEAAIAAKPDYGVLLNASFWVDHAMGRGVKVE